MHKSAWAGVALAGLAITGCAGPKGPPVAASALCAEWAGALCEAGRSCCARPGATPSRPCIDERRAWCEKELEPLVADPRTAWSAERGGDWIARLRAARTDCSTGGDAVGSPETSAGFLDAFDGTGAPGADCTPVDASPRELLLARLSCGRGGRCRLGLRASGALRGTCEVLPDEDRRTAEDLACSHAFDCPWGLWCDLPAPWTPGLWGDCRPARADGWRCGGPGECRSGLCAAPSEGAPAACRTPTADERYCPLSGGAGPAPADAGIPDAASSDAAAEG